MRSDIDRSYNHHRNRPHLPGGYGGDAYMMQQSQGPLPREPRHLNRWSMDMGCSEYTDKYSRERQFAHKGQGHSKDYYDMLTSIVRSKIATLLLTIAEEEENIEE